MSRILQWVAPLSELVTLFKSMEEDRCFFDVIDLLLEYIFKTDQVNHHLKVPIFFSMLLEKA